MENINYNGDNITDLARRKKLDTSSIVREHILYMSRIKQSWFLDLSSINYHVYNGNQMSEHTYYCHTNSESDLSERTNDSQCQNNTTDS